MVNALHKDKNIHCLQKKSIQLTLQYIIKNSVWACIITEQIVIYLLMV